MESKAKAKEPASTAHHSGPPDFQLSVKTAAGEQLMGEVDEKGKVKWDPCALHRNFRTTPDVFEAGLRAFRSA